ncbi:MAG: LysE family transporter [Rhodoferax sp.]|nr:LysE family transporter [Rhodoferax sp.]
MFDTPIFVNGLALGLGIFICPGPKDVLILRQALLGRPSFELIAIGCISDALLIWLAIAGLSAVFVVAPVLQSAALWFGTCLLAGHGILAARSAIRGGDVASALSNQDKEESPGKSWLALLSVSFLNPVAWLDAVLIVGSVGAALPQSSQVSFGLGAVAASLGWFAALVLGVRGAARWMTSPHAWRLLDGLVAVAMLGLAIHVAWDLI